MKQLAFLLLLLFLGSNITYGQVKTLRGKKISETEMDTFLKKQMDDLKLPGLSIAIINNGKIIYHRSLGSTNINSKEKVDDFTLFEAGSLSKPLFAYYVVKTIEKGKLHLDTPLYKYLSYPDIEHDERYKLITARMILSHTSGFPNWRYMNQGNQLNIQFTPGTQFAYSGEGYEYLAKVVAHLSGCTLKNIDENFRSEVCLPLGIKNSYFITNKYVTDHMAWPHAGDTVTMNDQSWDRTEFNSAGGLRTESLDYAKFLIGMMKDKGLKKKNMEEMLKAQVKLPEDNPIRKIGGYTSWGLGFALKETTDGTIYVHAGVNHGFQSACAWSKEKKIGYVFFTNCDKGMELNQKLETFLMEGN